MVIITNMIMIQGQVQCYNETKTIVVDTPVEECELEPRQNCRHATKQVPKLVSVQVRKALFLTRKKFTSILYCRSVLMSLRRCAPGAGAIPGGWPGQ